MDFTFDTVVGGFGQRRVDSDANPSNQIFHAPSSAEEIELRPNLKIETAKSKLSLILKPRAKGSFVQYETPNATSTDFTAINRGELNAHFNEAYVRIGPFRHLEFTFGIENYQWGSSEVLSASQFLFPELILKPDPFQEIRGVELTKLEFQASQEWTFTGMAEMRPAGLEHEDALNYRVRDFKRRALLRAEYAGSSGEFLLGGVVGKKETDDQPRVVGGGYGFWSYSQGGQIYFDYIGQQGSERLWINNVGTLSQQNSDLTSLYSIGILGHRYAFKNGMELKIELIENDFGVSTGLRNSALAQIRANSPKTANYIAFLQDQTTPLPGKTYGYAALRIDDPIGLRSLFHGSRITLRDLGSFDDQTQVISLTFESALSDHFAQSLVAASAFGQDDGELTNTVRAFGSYYVKYSF
jgi:hypothetical protein